VINLNFDCFNQWKRKRFAVCVVGSFGSRQRKRSSERSALQKVLCWCLYKTHQGTDTFDFIQPHTQYTIFIYYGVNNLFLLPISRMKNLTLYLESDATQWSTHRIQCKSIRLVVSMRVQKLGLGHTLQLALSIKFCGAHVAEIMSGLNIIQKTCIRTVKILKTFSAKTKTLCNFEKQKSNNDQSMQLEIIRVNYFLAIYLHGRIIYFIMLS